MKKLLVVLNGSIFPQHVTEAAISMAKESGFHLHAVFMNSALEFEEYGYAFPNDLSLTRNDLTGKTLAEESDDLLAVNTQLFGDMCNTANLSFTIEQNKEITLGMLTELSAFSDLIITDATPNLNQYHVIDLLAEARCPVYLVSKEVQKIENIILTYDGSFSSIYAIKQYAQLFPEMRKLPTSLVYIDNDENDEFPREKNIKTWLPQHYSNVQYKILHGDVRDELVNYVKSIPDSLVIMGSFGRSAFSRLFHKSLANAVIADGRSALFIAHG
jgi:hypothetical protein